MYVCNNMYCDPVDRSVDARIVSDLLQRRVGEPQLLRDSQRRLNVLYDNIMRG